MPIKVKQRAIVFVLIAGLGAIGLHRAPARSTAPTQENRGLWLTSIGLTGLYHSTLLDETLSDLSQRGFNTLYPAVWNRGQTLYPSRVVPAAFTLGDVLSTTVREGKRQGLRIIPWFEYGLKVTDRSALARQHPEWLARDRNGRPYINPEPVNALPFPLKGLSRAVTGADHVVLNPIHPQVQNLIVKMFVDVVKRYNVDGIQIDDHFALPVQLGYDSYTRQRFRQEQGVEPPADPTDPAWMEWRANKLTELVGKISTAIKQQKPAIVFSIAPNPPAFAYRTTLQDWPTWVRRGYVDEVVVQVYRPTVAEMEAIAADPQIYGLQAYVPVSLGLYAGPGLKAKTGQQLDREVAVTRRLRYNGFALFSWEFAIGPLARGRKVKFTGP